jgi:hypothetical protein
VDVFPSDLLTAFAHGLDYRPRPVIQSYAAYSDELGRANAEHYAGGHAPRSVLLSATSINDRLPTMDDGSAWLELLRRYDPTAAIGDVLVLRRRPMARPWSRRLVERRVLRWGEPWVLDPGRSPGAGGWLWCRIDVTPNLEGRIASALYRLPTVRLHVATDSGQHDFRLIPASARSGFLLEPLIVNQSDLPELWSPWSFTAAPSRFTARRTEWVRELRLSLEELPAAQRLFEGHVEVEIWQIIPQPPAIHEAAASPKDAAVNPRRSRRR